MHEFGEKTLFSQVLFLIDNTANCLEIPLCKIYLTEITTLIYKDIPEYLSYQVKIWEGPKRPQIRGVVDSIKICHELLGNC